MPTVEEAVNAASERDPLLQGLSVLSQYEEILFSQYIRHVLPLDGYVFWLRTQSTTIKGSLHISANKRQLEDETISINRVVFTTGEPVQEFNDIGPNTIWIAETCDVRFAFSHRGPFYRAAGLYHYSGDAVYPALRSQIIDLGQQLSDQELVVSNSLPAWLALQSYTPEWLVVPNPGITLYPSFLVPDNIQPPYGSVHIIDDQTDALAPFPVVGYGGQHSQLVSDRVRVTLYGATNAQALAWLDVVNQYSRDTDIIGMMEPAIVRDEKRTQAEIGVLAMKKTLTFKVSYLQSTLPGVARQLIFSAIATMLPQLNGVI